MPHDELPIPRKRFVLGAGLAAAATALAACSTYGEKPPEASPPSPDQPAADALTKTSDVPVGSGVIVDKVVVTQPSAGEFKGFSAICTHAGCTVSEVAGGTINCRCHGSKYNLDGSVANGPATKPLESKPVSVQGDSIVLG
jgi:Rieske Fe-S protein